MKTRTERIIERLSKYPVILVLGCLAIVLSFITDVPERVYKLYHWTRQNWTNTDTYEKIGHVAMGLSRTKIDTLFGPSMTSRQVTNGYSVATYGTASFRLCVIYNDDAVVAWSVTSKKTSFRPSIQLEDNRKVRLGKATFHQWTPDQTGQQKYEAVQGVKDIWYQETTYLGNRRGYETLFLAHSIAGGAPFPFVVKYVCDLDPFSPEPNWISPLQDEPTRKSLVFLLRSSSVPNTVGFSLLHEAPETEIDVNWILLREGSRTF
ncbi:MAG: hypothetical protein PHR77_13160 [Kiritimatiellae bacterium]|nr:hypothetical protein [Kiritimatiellia bacterium]MDD5520174.1 hypothetical protein [Kiritimatiellia bacterium]